MTTEEQFEIVWRSYPRKIAKATARLAFKKAIKIATVEQMLEGISRYVANKPDWMDYKHPATWLRSEGWEDQWEPQQPKVSSTRPSETAEQHRRREILIAKFREARDSGNMEEANRIRAQIG